MRKDEAVRLLIGAGVLMLFAGCIFGFMRKWACAVPIWVGAGGCFVAAFNFKNRKDE